jgi:hypothetical protein
MPNTFDGLGHPGIHLPTFLVPSWYRKHCDMQQTRCLLVGILLHVAADIFGLSTHDAAVRCATNNRSFQHSRFVDAIERSRCTRKTPVPCAPAQVSKYPGPASHNVCLTIQIASCHKALASYALISSLGL